MGVMVANALAPVIVNKDSDIPFMVGLCCRLFFCIHTEVSMKNIVQSAVLNLFTLQF